MKKWKICFEQEHEGRDGFTEGKGGEFGWGEVRDGMDEEQVEVWDGWLEDVC